MSVCDCKEPVLLPTPHTNCFPGASILDVCHIGPLKAVGKKSKIRAKSNVKRKDRFLRRSLLHISLLNRRVSIPRPL